jgi:hypothetical protein
VFCKIGIEGNNGTDELGILLRQQVGLFWRHDYLLLTDGALMSSFPFSLPAKLSPALERVRGYWDTLKRADNNMPFWDDVKLSALPDQADSLLLIDVFVLPERFRFNTLGKDLAQRYREALISKFLDELDLRAPFSYLRAQCSATVEARAPTYFSDADYSRLLLPMWGNGRIGMLLGVVGWQ